MLYEWLYFRGKPRWDTGITPPEVRHLIEVENFPPGRALDIGCGTGTNVVYLAQHGFEVVGIDFVQRAVEKARAKARASNLAVDLRVANVLEHLELGAPFDFVLDIGCFHNFDEAGRALYADNLDAWTHVGSTFLLYAFYPATIGPRRFGVTPQAVADTFVRHFKLTSSTVDAKNPEQDSAWYRLERVDGNGRGQLTMKTDGSAKDKIIEAGRKPVVRGGHPGLEPKHVRDSQLTLAVAMNPADANPLGDVHGGVIMKLVDEAGGICAIRHARRPTVTVTMDSMTFLSPVRVGDLVTLRASINWIGRTSIEVGIRVEAENVLTGQVTHTNSAYAVYVALGDDGKPTAVPPLILDDDEELRHWEEGVHRQGHRLSRAHRKIKE